MRKLCVVVLVFCFPLLAFGQLKTLASPTQFPNLLRSTLQAGEAAMGLIGLDPEKLQMTHSYSMSVFSGGEQSISQALYLNTLVYQFDAPLTVALQWGMAHQPFATSSAFPAMENGPFFSYAGLSYQPAQNTLIEFKVQRLPYPYYRNYSPFYFSE